MYTTTKLLLPSLADSSAYYYFALLSALECVLVYTQRKGKHAGRHYCTLGKNHTTIANAPKSGLFCFED